ncbi:hypothetical protein HU200_024360 [Digitaria exilis]|uniref:Uncharacterized protein n=1 Tax=Digitaria exilis TaxID=1010633 RepID=A0A835CBH6_9POAL|nr:hypothetical protein HU200_024360 [Digitaria exilis]
MRLRLPRLPAPQYASQSQSSIPSLLTSWPCGCCIFLRVAQVHQFMEIKRKDVWGLLFVLLLGQLVAFSMAISSFTSSLIANLGVHAPLAQSFFAYLLVDLLYVPIVLYRLRKLQSGGSTLFNLSLLTSDMWAVAIRVLFYRQQINWLYYVAFGVVAIGLIIYSMNESSLDDERAASTEAAAQYEQVQGEDNSGGSGSDSRIQERTHMEEAHIC